MYIKQVIIQGFRSYRDQTVIDPFSPKHNVVVGRNGSGKSNFFLAIQFVLSDEFSHMRQEERQQLLHEGTGPRVVSAYVEIIFDNTDNRIPIDKDEVTLRRVIGSKKDQYFLDKKNITKTDVMNLLESAGFSRSNPYYIVKQGRINQLAVAKDNERLKLLREVAGTRVYDERKAESENILTETESKRDKIEDLLKYIEERLGTLETEKEELKQYQRWDKEKRCLEYTIHDKELRETREKLDKIESSKKDDSERANTLQKEVQDAADKIEELNKKVKEILEQCSVIKMEKDQLEVERQEQLKQRTKLELDVKDLEDGVKEDEHLRLKENLELKQLDEAISKHEEELSLITPKFEERKNTEHECQLRLQSCEQRRTDLFSKQGRGTTYKNKEERDNFLKKEIHLLKLSINTKEKKMANTRNDIEETKKKIKNLELEISDRSENLDHRKKEMEASNRKYSELKMKRDELINKQRELWRQQNAIETAISSTRNDLGKAERDLRHTMSKSAALGIESVRRVKDEKNIDGIFGPLIENFTCSDKFFTAVDVAGGSKLFNIVVETDKVGTMLLSHINRMKLPGEVTLMPLNRLNFKDLEYPSTSDAIPMLHKLDYDSKFKPAMQLAFGKTLICRNEDVASQFSKSHDLDAITMDGDRYSRRGTLEGGYVNRQTNRLTLQRKIWDLKEKEEEQSKELEEIRHQLQELDGKITSVLSDLQRTETDQINLRQTYERQKLDVRNLQKEKDSAENGLGPKERSLVNDESDCSMLKDSLKSYQDELGTELNSQLSFDDQNEVDRLNEEIVDLKNTIKDVFKERTNLEAKKQKLDNLLKANLYKKREELKTDLEEVGIENKSEQLELKRNELTSYSSMLERSSQKIKELNDEMNVHKDGVKEEQRLLEKLKAKEREKRQALEEETKAMEKNTNKKSILLKKKDDCVKKIRELGSLPSDAFDKYHKFPTKVLWNKLKDATEELKKYNHVNKKALDQFISFSDQKEKLIKRKEELVKAHEAIVDLMDVLEQRKHEAILFTFKQVSHNFTDIFKQLVPGGKAQLIMKKEAKDTEDENSESQSQSSSQRSQKSFDEFSGVSIKVSFTGKSAETLEMNQLSGGQKTLVALTLIFAIQKCDPAPFYLFDEIDQALDPSYRKSVAAMIHNLADKAQFITTTFRPELLESAEKFYGVQFKNKVSHILSITKDEAKDFVEDECQDGQPPN